MIIDGVTLDPVTPISSPSGVFFRAPSSGSASYRKMVSPIWFCQFSRPFAGHPDSRHYWSCGVCNMEIDTVSILIGRRAVVIGAGMSGLAATRALADHFEEVIVIERDSLPTDSTPRTG